MSKRNQASNVRIMNDLEPGSLSLPITVTKRKLSQPSNSGCSATSIWASLLRKVGIFDFFGVLKKLFKAPRKVPRETSAPEPKNLCVPIDPLPDEADYIPHIRVLNRRAGDRS